MNMKCKNLLPITHRTLRTNHMQKWNAGDRQRVNIRYASIPIIVAVRGRFRYQMPSHCFLHVYNYNRLNFVSGYLTFTMFSVLFFSMHPVYKQAKSVQCSGISMLWVGICFDMCC